MYKQLIYLDNCCFNRPFDDQTQDRIRSETESKLLIQNFIRAGNIDLAWSFVLEYENECNPFVKRRVFTSSWAGLAKVIIQPQPDIFQRTRIIMDLGLSVLDAMHLACAEQAKVSCFLTTDRGILGKGEIIGSVPVSDPGGFILTWKGEGQ